MSSYGRVISGGAQMRKGLDKSINDKLTGFGNEQERRKMLADSVKKAIYKGDLSEPKLNNVNASAKGQKFTVPKQPSKI